MITDISNTFAAPLIYSCTLLFQKHVKWADVFEESAAKEKVRIFLICYFNHSVIRMNASKWKNKAPSYKTWSKTFTWNSHCIITNKAVSILHKYLNLLDASYGFNHYSIWLKQIPIYYWYSCEGEIELFPLRCVWCKIIRERDWYICSQCKGMEKSNWSQ